MDMVVTGVVCIGVCTEVSCCAEVEAMGDVSMSMAFAFAILLLGIEQQVSSW